MSSIPQKSFNHHFIFITPIRMLLIMNRIQRSLTPYSKLRRAYSEHCFASWFGTMPSSRAPNSAVHRTRVKQRGSRVKPEVATVSLAWGAFGGGDGRARIKTEQEQLNPGDSPRRWRRAQAYIDIMHALELKYTTLSISCSTVFLQGFLRFKFKPILHAFLSFFTFSVQRSNVRIFLFLFTNFIVYIEIWQMLDGWNYKSDRCSMDEIIRSAQRVMAIDYRCDNRSFWLSTHNCQVPTPTSHNLQLEQQIRIFGAV